MKILINKSDLYYSNLNHVNNIVIDYATNCLHGYINGKDIILFNFTDYGLILDNRKHKYKIIIELCSINIIFEKY